MKNLIDQTNQYKNIMSYLLLIMDMKLSRWPPKLKIGYSEYIQTPPNIIFSYSTGLSLSKLSTTNYKVIETNGKQLVNYNSPNQFKIT